MRTRTCWRPPGIERAAGFVAGTDNDTTNLSLVAAARRANPELFVAARQNKQASAPLFAAVQVDSLLVPAEVVAHEVYAQLATPLLWRFIREMPARGNDWADRLIGKLTHLCGKRLQSIWRVQLNDVGAAGVARHGRRHARCSGSFLRSPDDRDERLPAVVLLAVREAEFHLAPSDDFRAGRRRRAAAGRRPVRAAAARLHPARRRHTRVRAARSARADELGLAGHHGPSRLSCGR